MSWMLLGLLSLPHQIPAGPAKVVDDPSRFDLGVCGRIAEFHGVKDGRAIKGATLTLALDRQGTFLNLDLSPRTTVRIAYEEGTLADLKVGQRVSLRLGPDYRTVIRILAEGKIRDARILEIKKNGRFTIVEDDPDTAEVKESEIELARDAIVRIGGLPATRAELRPEMRVPLEFSRNGKWVNAIDADGNERDLLYGQLLGVNQKDNKIEFSAEENDAGQPISRWLPLASDAIIIVDDKIAAKADLKSHSEIKMRLAPDGKSIRALKAISPPPEGDPRP